MGRKVWKLSVLFFCCLLFPLMNIQAAGLFQHRTSGPVILIGEIQSYGDYELKPVFFNTFADRLNHQLQNRKVAVIDRGNVTNEAGRHDWNGTPEDRQLSQIHMDAIVHGHQFEYGYATAKLKRYADEKVGRAHFYDDAKTKEWHERDRETYRLSPELQPVIQQIADKYGATDILFVNDKDIDVRLKGTVFASKTERETRGKKMKARLDYYLVNASTGVVYEGHFENKKTAQMMNFGIVQSGKGMNVDEMLNAVMKVQSEEVAEDVVKNGLKAVSAR